MTTPNACVILPAEATHEMYRAYIDQTSQFLHAGEHTYRAMVAAAPNAGKVGAEMLEAAARAICFSDGQTDWPLDEGDRSDFRRMARAAFEAIGLTVDG